MNFSETFLRYSKNVIDNINFQDIEDIVDILVEIKDNGGRLFIIGSGGGAGHASHAVCDFRKLCNIESYAPYDNISELTARINDDSWESSIVNWLKVSKFNYNDFLLTISVGVGNVERKISMNIVNAILYANEINSKIIGIVGRDGGITNTYGKTIVIPTITEDLVTPLTEGFQSIIWHLIVSHPKLKTNQTKW
ncbi:SIS domain-containing protein [Candidatus Dojkabacteria bacterium]|jgi:D-sedoheptulose 7-phosphate isomerase|nr:SIS domain-containing protein [Candidatus Dojkabacteria bacterium]